MKTTRENIKNRIEEINKELEKITKLDKKFPQGELPVSYTHLDVYKRQVQSFDETFQQSHTGHQCGKGRLQ